jgi:hypothetical protein
LCHPQSGFIRSVLSLGHTDIHLSLVVALALKDSIYMAMGHRPLKAKAYPYGKYTFGSANLVTGKPLGLLVYILLRYPTG